jgi:hypothetical protein
MSASINARTAITVLTIAGLLLLPLYSAISGNIFVLTLFTRIVIFGLWRHDELRSRRLSRYRRLCGRHIGA